MDAGAACSGAAWRSIAGGVQLHVRVTPGAKREAFGGLWRDADGRSYVTLAVRARAVDGAANTAVAATLAEHFGARASDVALVRGARGRLKSFDIHAPDAADRAAALLADAESEDAP